MTTREQRAFIFDLIQQVNARNETSTCAPEVRQGWNSLLCCVLHAHDLYAGFWYIRANELRDRAVGMDPGIIFDESEAREHQYPDETRVTYYVHEKLRNVCDYYVRNNQGRRASTSMPCEHCGHGTTRRVLLSPCQEKADCGEQWCIEARQKKEKISA